MLEETEEQSRMDNLETQVTLDLRHRTKTKQWKQNKEI
jgi:hypothetical protein